MQIRELRVRYELKTAYGFPEVNAVVCTFPELAIYIRKIKEVGYRLVGVDERFRDEKRWMPLNEGWTEIQPIAK